MHIAIAGNIGSGKTTLTKMLARHYGWKPNFESVEFNPYLDDFYADMSRWSFNLQIYVLEDGAVLDDGLRGLGDFHHILESLVEEVNL